MGKFGERRLSLAATLTATHPDPDGEALRSKRRTLESWVRSARLSSPLLVCSRAQNPGGGMPGGMAGGPGGGLPSQQQVQQQQEKAKQQEEMRKDLLQKVLTPEAADRLARIALVKPDKARKLEDMVLMMAQKGQVQSQITDSYMKQMLEGISDGVRSHAIAHHITPPVSSPRPLHPSLAQAVCRTAAVLSCCCRCGRARPAACTR